MTDQKSAAPHDDDTGPARDMSWSVTDKNAVAARRMHEPVIGRRYELSATEPTKMPQGHALKFLQSKSFEVRNELGQVVSPMAEDAKGRQESLSESLRPGEVIANLRELSKEALLARAAMYPGGERFKKNSKPDDVIEFINESSAGQNPVMQDMQGDADSDPLGAAGAKEILPSMEQQLASA